MWNLDSKISDFFNLFCVSKNFNLKIQRCHILFTLTHLMQVKQLIFLTLFHYRFMDWWWKYFTFWTASCCDYWIIKVFKTECMGNKGVCLLVQNCPICHPNGSVNKKLYPISNCNPLINWNHSKKYWLVENWDRGTKYIVCGFNFVNTLTKGGYEIILIKHYPNTYTEKANLVILDS